MSYSTCQIGPTASSYWWGQRAAEVCPTARTRRFANMSAAACSRGQVPGLLNWGPNVLFRMPNTTNCILLVARPGPWLAKLGTECPIPHAKYDQPYPIGCAARFLGLLHMEVFLQRLEMEHGTSVITTPPTVPYTLRTADGQQVDIQNPSQYPTDAKARRCGGIVPAE
jgi:hypothetical protein